MRAMVRDYAELARLGQVSRARIQIMSLLHLAPDLQGSGPRGAKQPIPAPERVAIFPRVSWGFRG
jgi:hypothetical protein